jgi:hypothetical protein
VADDDGLIDYSLHPAIRLWQRMKRDRAVRVRTLILITFIMALAGIMVVLIWQLFALVGLILAGVLAIRLIVRGLKWIARAIRRLMSHKAD